MNSPFGNRPNGGNAGNRSNNGKFTDTVILDNKVHRQLAEVRDRAAVAPTPSDQEMRQRNAQEQSQRHLATLYRMPAMKDPDSVTHSAETVPALPPSSVVTFHDCMRRLEMETKRAIKFQRPFSLAIVGFGDLIHVANTYGVSAYEQALHHIGDVLTNIVDTDIDVVGRYSNDRFMVLLPECTGPNSTMIAETARQYFEASPVSYNSHAFFLRASIGIACFPNHGRDWKEILARADLACESVLAKGGNAFGFASMI